MKGQGVLHPPVSDLPAGKDRGWVSLIAYCQSPLPRAYQPWTAWWGGRSGLEPWLCLLDRHGNSPVVDVAGKRGAWAQAGTVRKAVRPTGENEALADSLIVEEIKEAHPTSNIHI